MIYAEHKKWADFIFKHYLNGLFNRHFFAIHLLTPVPDFDREKPLLLLPNHSTWWDGFFIYLLNKKVLKRKIYLMMLEEQLKQNRFFRLLGTYSIKLDTIKDVKESLNYTIDLLNKEQEPPLVCFFPQGELQAWHERPLIFKRGLELILKNVTTKINLCYLGIRIEYLGEQRPEVFLQISPVREINKKNQFLLKGLESEFNTFIDQFEKRIIGGTKGELLFQGKKSVNEQFQRLRKKGVNK